MIVLKNKKYSGIVSADTASIAMVTMTAAILPALVIRMIRKIRASRTTRITRRYWGIGTPGWMSSSRSST
eukprot:SAG31_NODE_6039_length_2197_cov_1.136320_2_plen_70_part_00